MCVCDYGAKYPDVIPLKTIATVASAMTDIFSRAGIPCEIYYRTKGPTSCQQQ